MIQANKVLKLTGLSANQLREWTHRRGLVKPDIRPAGPGTLALYSWQTVLVLRLAVEMRDAFRMELQTHKNLLDGLAQRLAGVSFPALAGCRLACYAGGEWALLRPGEQPRPQRSVVLLRLDPHLDILAAEFDRQEPLRQLPLFPAVQVK
jgi:DNA-binding transcriptional MerR regulator